MSALATPIGDDSLPDGATIYPDQYYRVARAMAVKQVSTMAYASIRLDDLTAKQRIELMGRLWDSLDPAAAAPITDALAAELDRREAEADSHPQGGQWWSEIKATLGKKLR